MTRLLEIHYLVGVPLGLGALVAALFLKKARLWLLAGSVAFIGAWTLSVNALSARSALILDHGRDPRTTAEIIHSLGKPESTLTSAQSDSVWIYSVRVWPFNAMVWYAIAQDAILDVQIGEKVGIFHDPVRLAMAADTPDSVSLYRAAQDITTWVILTSAREELKGWPIFQGMWTPTREDIPTVIDAAFSYVREFEKEPKEEPGKRSPPMVLYEQRACRHILGFRPNYACQIVGYTRSGKKMIHLNFFPRLMIAVTRALPGTTEPSWHSQYVWVLDGGPSFWQIEYDPATKTFSDFRANGMG